MSIKKIYQPYSEKEIKLLLDTIAENPSNITFGVKKTKERIFNTLGITRSTGSLSGKYYNLRDSGTKILAVGSKKGIMPGIKNTPINQEVEDNINSTLKSFLSTRKKEDILKFFLQQMGNESKRKLLVNFLNNEVS